MNAEKFIGQHAKVIKTNNGIEEVKYYEFQDYFGISPFRAKLREINGEEEIEVPLPKVIDALKNSKTIRF